MGIEPNPALRGPVALVLNGSLSPNKTTNLQNEDNQLVNNSNPHYFEGPALSGESERFQNTTQSARPQGSVQYSEQAQQQNQASNLPARGQGSSSASTMQVQQFENHMSAQMEAAQKQAMVHRPTSTAFVKIIINSVMSNLNAPPVFLPLFLNMYSFPLRSIFTSWSIFTEEQ